MVGTTAELAQPGDFLTCVVANTVVHIRNFAGQIRALSNVCAHRHAMICSSSRGNSPAMRCQYHGWEYQADGRTGKIPEPKNFVPFDREATCLPTYQLETVGQLVFVNVSDSTTSLHDFLGKSFYDLVADRFSADWTLALKWQPDYQVNWKIPIENSLEAYHVPAVHPHTFREDPGSERSQHGLLPNRTWFSTSLPFSPHSRLDATFQRFESHFVRWLGYETSGSYQQHHIFPNLLFSFTDAISLVNCVLPTGPKSCQAVVRQFGRLPPQAGVLRRRPVRTLAAKCWSRLTASVTQRVLVEDLGIFSAIQAGLERSPHAGILGRCEERIHSFHEFLQRTASDNAQDERHD